MCKEDKELIKGCAILTGLFVAGYLFLVLIDLLI